MDDWYECAPYGEQIPKILDLRISEYLAANGKTMTPDECWNEMMESEAGSPWWQLFECIFVAGMEYAAGKIDGAVYDKDAEALKLIGLEPFGDVFCPVNDNCADALK